MSDQLFEKDIIVTGESGSMGAVLIDNSVTSSGPNTRLILSQFVFDPAEKTIQHGSDHAGHFNEFAVQVYIIDKNRGLNT